MFDDFQKFPMLWENCERPGPFLYAFRPGLEDSVVYMIVLFLEIESTITTVLKNSRKWPRFTLPSVALSIAGSGIFYNLKAISQVTVYQCRYDLKRVCLPTPSENNCVRFSEI